MDQHRSELHSSNWRMGRLIADSGVKVFQIETTLNTDTFPAAFAFLQKREWEWRPQDRAWPSWAPPRRSTARPPATPARSSTRSAPHRMTSVQAGEVEAVHAVTTANVWAQQGVVVEGQTDILTMGLPYICPYNVNSIMNPILVACLGLGYFFNIYRGKPLVREGGVVIMTPPHPVGVQPGPPPQLHRLLRAGAGETTDPDEMSKRVRGVLRHRPVVRPPLPDGPRLPRRPPLLHVVLVRPRPRAPGRGDHRRRRPDGRAPAGFRPASTMADALEMATDVVGPSPSLTHLHAPPILMADVR